MTDKTGDLANWIWTLREIHGEEYVRKMFEKDPRLEARVLRSELARRAALRTSGVPERSE